MKPILVATLLLLPTLTLAQVCNPACANQPAQCCNVPQADVFAAYESDTHDAPAKPFRLLAPATAAAGACVTESTITNLDATVAQPDAQFETVDAPSLGNLLFRIKLRLLFGGLLGTLNGQCFKLDTQGFMHPPSPITFTDGCGTHTLTLSSPRYACVLDIGRTLVCFRAKRVGTDTSPLPPGTDRLEDVCALVDVIP
ncbi:MAG TPA: hypothetical protein VLK79_16645 [Gaiellales bacterium]|nr:hypothetical protein [Gaiellales bacterium]